MESSGSGEVQARPQPPHDLSSEERRVLESRIRRQQHFRFASCQVEDLSIPDEIGHTKIGDAVLADSANLPRPSLFQIGLSEVETVGRPEHRLDALLSLAGSRLALKQNTDAALSSPADAPSELMELRQAETSGVLDDHDGGVGNI